MGLINLGNTCYMNAAMECLLNTEELSKYFLLNLHHGEINYTNLMGSQGRLAEVYADLVQKSWNEKRGSVKPIKFKDILAGVNEQYEGNEQHDSFELLNYVLDTLHEDLNRIKDKPYNEYIEKGSDNFLSSENWKLFLERNRSVMVDIFFG